MRFTHGVMRGEATPELRHSGYILKELGAFQGYALHVEIGDCPAASHFDETCEAGFLFVRQKARCARVVHSHYKAKLCERQK
jgi:hypothetical protein